MSKVFTPEKVRELIEKYNSCETVWGENAVITELLEQNPIEPIVVGLSDEQIESLTEFIFDETGCGVAHFIEKWLKTQTFAQPEVKEVVVGLDDKQILRLGEAIRSNPEASCTAVIREWLKNQTFAPAESFKAAMEEVSTCNEEIARLERLNNLLHDLLKEQLESHQSEQPEVKEVAVGLSDEQILDLDVFLTNAFSIPTIDTRKDLIKMWQKTQTFAQCRAFKEVVVGLSDEQVIELVESLEMTPISHYYERITDYLKTQTFAQQSAFRPNWSDADERADTFTVMTAYSGNGFSSVDYLKKYERPKPTPQVEVGQFWKHLGIKFKITQVIHGGRDYEVMCVSDVGFDYKGMVSDFLAKFERVT